MQFPNNLGYTEAEGHLPGQKPSIGVRPPDSQGTPEHFLLPRLFSV